MDLGSQTRHCDVSFYPWCQVKGEKNRKLTCDLTLATVCLLLPVWSGWFRPLRVHVWLPSHHAGSLAATSNISLSAGFCSMCFTLNCNRFLPKKKIIKTQFSGVGLVFFFHFSLPHFFLSTGKSRLFQLRACH